MVNGDGDLVQLIPVFFMQMGIGAAMGWLLGTLMTHIVNRINLDYDGLYPVLLLSMVLFTYAATDQVYGNGFLAVYIAGMILGNNDFIHKRSLIRFYDGLAWLWQIIMFLTLGLLAFPKNIVPVMGAGLAISLVLIFVARPIAVFLSLLPFRISLQRRVFISWMGLRGAVPIIFATYPLTAGIANAGFIFNIVFFIVLTSVALQGSTLVIVARWLGLERATQPRRTTSRDLEYANELTGELHELLVKDESPAVGKPLVKLRIPAGVVISVIQRDGIHLVPNGNTVVLANDRLFVVVPDERTLETLIDRLELREMT
jgi:potassium/hydrogen antiporter